jgi:integrase
MRKYSPENERVKREYLAWLRNAQGRSGATLDMVAAAINRFEAHAGYRDFKTFRREQAISFKQHLAQQTNRAGKALSKSTLYSTLNHVRAFFEWLWREPGYRSRFQFSDAAYFNLSDNDARVATAARERPYPSIEQVRHVLLSAPSSTVFERRDRAVIAFILLTGARDSAAASMRLKHVNPGERKVFHDAREVRTKAAKTFTSFFFPVGAEIEEIVAAWLGELRSEYLFGPDDPLFPATRMGLDHAGHFGAVGLGREPWTSAAPIRAAFRKAFQSAGLPYFIPHSVRRTLMHLGYELNLSQREMKAWSQNLGHESMLTSLASYGALSIEEQGQAMAGVTAQSGDLQANAKLLMELATKMAGAARR